MQTSDKTFLERVTENQNFVFFTFAFILFPLMLHTSKLLLMVSSINDNWYAYSFALGFDLAILHFAVNGRMAQAGAMAFVIFIINVCFYNSQLMFESFNPLIVKLLITLVISGTSAWVVHTYVVLFISRKEKADKVQELFAKNYSQEKVIDSLRKELTQAQETINEINEKSQEGQDVIIQSLQNELREMKVLSNRTGREALSSINSNEKSSVIFCEGCQNEFTGQKSYDAYKKICQLCKKTDGELNQSKLKTIQV